MSRNNVRGPTSALTEFLRESGITPTTIARRRARAEAANANQPEAGPSNAGQNADGDENAEDVEQTSPRRRRRNGVSYLILADLIRTLIILHRLRVMVQMIWTSPKKIRLRPKSAS
jgi:hypothetical protein